MISKVIKGSKKAEVATVIAPFTATSAEQLSLQKGQLVKIRKKTTTGWWEGELQVKLYLIELHLKLILIVISDLRYIIFMF